MEESLGHVSAGGSGGKAAAGGAGDAGRGGACGSGGRGVHFRRNRGGQHGDFAGIPRSRREKTSTSQDIQKLHGWNQM